MDGRMFVQVHIAGYSLERKVVSGRVPGAAFDLPSFKLQVAPAPEPLNAAVQR